MALLGPNQSLRIRRWENRFFEVAERVRIERMERKMRVSDVAVAFEMTREAVARDTS